jgi:hypothetical protein
MGNKKTLKSCWTTLSGPEDAKTLLGSDLEAGATNWSISRHAVPDDAVIFYVTRPTSSFVAKGVVIGRPKADGKRWYAEIGGLERLGRQYQILQARADLPEWGWLKTPIGSVRVPEAILPQLWQRCARGAASLGPAFKPPLETTDGPPIPNDDEHPPSRIIFSATRIVRTTKKGIELKKRYKHTCQCCSKTVPVPGQSDGYVEVHHLRPLGREHNGMDNWDNMLVLCPNCHAAFDLVSFAINPKSGMIQMWGDKSPGTSIKFCSGHALSKENLIYHWRRFQPDEN